MRILSWLPRSFLLVLTFLLPLKFGSTVAVPEMPMSYWFDPLAIIVAAWPVMIFPLLSAVALALSLLCLPKKALPDKMFRLYAVLWGALLVSSLPGWLHASTWDFAAQNTAHLLGLVCWTLALTLNWEADRRFVAWLSGALFAGLIFSCYSAVNQYLSGFDDTLRYLQNKEAQSGMALLDGQFGNRLKEARVSGDFTVCNSYAGYLVLVFPVLLGALWRLGAKCTPPLACQLILTVPFAGLFLFLLKETGSRGGVLALLAGGFLALFCLRLTQRWKLLLWSLVPVGLAAFVLLVRYGRGFNSMRIRFDYFFAALKMTLLHPWCGAGWGEFLNDYLVLKNVVNDEAPHSPHNFILTLGSQCGVSSLLFSACVLLLPLIAVLILLNRKFRETDGACNDRAGSLALAWGLGAWTIHSLMELNYETPGSLALAILLGMLALRQTEELPRVRQLPDRWFSSYPAKGIFYLLCAGAAVGTLWYVPGVIRAEMNFDALHSATDARFAADPLKSRPEPEQVRKLLEFCDPRSPFPHAAVSSYYLTLGPYYTAEALTQLDRAIELSPKRSAYYFRKYRILQGAQRPAEAETALRRARELSPKNPLYYPDGITPFGSRSY